MVTTWDHPTGGSVELVSSPLKLSGTPVRRDLPPPLLGEHTDEVLREVLHLRESDIVELRLNKII